MAGKPKPNHLKIVSGNPGKRKLPENTPQPSVEVKEPPEWLDDYAKEVWRNLIGELIRLGLLSVLDYPLFTAFCITAAEMRHAYEKVAGVNGEPGEGRVYTIEGRNGEQRKTNPRIPQLREYISVLRQTGSELGLSPVARVKLTGVAQGDLFADASSDQGGNEFDEFR